MATESARVSVGTIRHRGRKLRPVRSRGSGARLARLTAPGLVAVTLCLVLAGAFVAFRTVANGAEAEFADGRVPTSFGALWIESSDQITVPQTNNKDNFGMPAMGAPDKVMLEVTLGLANTGSQSVELTPDRFALRLGPGEKLISVEGARFESVRLLPRSVFDARLQFPVTGGEHQLSLLFDDPARSSPITIDLGKERFQQPAGNSHQHH